MHSTQESPKSFTDFLREDFVQRCRQNSGYSLRTHAKKLEVDPSALSKILRGMRRPSMNTKLKMIDKLKLSPHMRNIASELAEIPEEKQTSTEKLREFQEDTFNVIQDWYHYAILELVDLRDFKPSVKWIANKLAISPEETKLAIGRLCRLELLDISDPQNWRSHPNNFTTPNNSTTTAAKRALQKKYLQMAHACLDDVDIQYRSQCATTISIDRSKMASFKKMIKQFIGKFEDRANQDFCKTDVYQMVVSFYPLTKSEEILREKKPWEMNE